MAFGLYLLVVMGVSLVPEILLGFSFCFVRLSSLFCSLQFYRLSNPRLTSSQWLSLSLPLLGDSLDRFLSVP